MVDNFTPVVQLGPLINDIAISAQSVNIQGGAVAGTTGLVAQSGNISITCTQDLQCSASNAGAPAAIQTFGSNVTATVGGSINLSGFTLISTPAPTGDILMVAGQNISIGTSVQIINNGTANSSLKLVVDNHRASAQAIYPRFRRHYFSRRKPSCEDLYS